MVDKIFSAPGGPVSGWEQLKAILHGVEKNVSLKNYTTYKIGGLAKYFFVAKNKEDLINAIKTAKKFKMPVFILGGGSNLLISDKGFFGMVIKIDILGEEFDGNKLTVGAGENLARLSYLLAEKSLSGLEWATGIPGATIGGSIYGNAQAFGTKISSIIESVQVVDAKTLKVKSFTKRQCKFSLKSSIFKKNTPQDTGKNLIIISAVLVFEKKAPEEIKKQIKEFLQYRRDKHPIEFPSPGSTFVNPEIKGETIPAGLLIAKCGLVGKRLGDAQISEKHANFIINLGEAKAKDVLALINLAKKKVKKVFGISLELEVQLVGM